MWQTILRFLVFPPIDIVQNTVGAVAMRTQRIIAWLLIVITPVCVLSALVLQSAIPIWIQTALTMVAVGIVAFDSATVAVALWAALVWERTVMGILREVFTEIGIPLHAINDTMQHAKKALDEYDQKTHGKFSPYFMAMLKSILTSGELASQISETVISNAPAKVITKIQEKIDETLEDIKNKTREQGEDWGLKLLALLRYIFMAGATFSFYIDEIAQNPQYFGVIVFLIISFILILPVPNKGIDIGNRPRKWLPLIGSLVLLAVAFGAEIPVSDKQLTMVLILATLAITIPTTLYVSGLYGLGPVHLLLGLVLAMQFPYHFDNVQHDWSGSSAPDNKEYETGGDIVLHYRRTNLNNGKIRFTQIKPDSAYYEPNTLVRSLGSIVIDENRDQFILVFPIDENGLTIHPRIERWVPLKLLEKMHQGVKQKPHKPWYKTALDYDHGMPPHDRNENYNPGLKVPDMDPTLPSSGSPFIVMNGSFRAGGIQTKAGHAV